MLESLTGNLKIINKEIIVESIETILSIMSREEKIGLITKQIRFVSRLPQYRKYLLSEAISLFYNQAVVQNEFVQKILEFYTIDHSAQLTCLQSESQPEKIVSVVSAMRKLVVQNDLSKKSTMAKVLFTVFKLK